MSAPLLSLCIPTNGIIELIFPVLDSIYKDETNASVDRNLYEVVIMDNGNNAKFHEMILDYSKDKNNLRYFHTDKTGFLSEAESYKVATGEFIKFINHRTKLLSGTIQYFLDFIEKYQHEKPFVYFLNGAKDDAPKFAEYKTFDQFVLNLSYWSSWSTGMGFWKSDFDMIPEDLEFNELFPHTTILFSQRHKDKYIIDNKVLLDEIPISHANKGRYDLFYAFAVEYPGILLDLVRDGDVSHESFLKLKDDILNFVASLYFSFCIRKEPCSYDLSGLDSAINVFYNKAALRNQTLKIIAKKAGNKIRHSSGQNKSY
jgi:hypothetical protein